MTHIREGKTTMRLAALTLISSLALATVPAVANAAPAIPNVPAPISATLMQVSGGCGPAFHPNPWGYCVANHYGYGYGGWHGYYGPHYGWGYHPYWHHW
jgi:hypothetical protein